MLKVVFWDVQHGHATYINTPNDKHFVIDLGIGSNDDGEFSPLLHLKTKYGIKKLDHVTITHPHTDHVDDILNFDELSPKTLSRPKHLTEEDIRKANKSNDRDKMDKYLEINDRYHVTIADGENPILSENNGGVSFQSFFPKSCSTSNINNHSIVSVIEYLGVKILVPGDNENPSWKELLGNKKFMTAIKGTDVFLASHHGRESGYCVELFEHFIPKLIIVSDGPVKNTDIASYYSKIASGWDVNRRSGGSKKRYCLTTRSDGVISVVVGKTINNSTYLSVTVD